MPPSDTTPGLYVTDAPQAGQVALTFDDGPFVRQTPPILDLLAAHRYPATFFVLGRNIDRTTIDILQRMRAEGHVIASHSYNHDVNMAAHPHSVDYIRGQHETTRMLIDLGLRARTGDDFDAMYRHVFARDPGVWMKASSLRDWRTYRERYQQLLSQRDEDIESYVITYSRPPAGNPYHASDPAPRARYGAAITAAGMLNILWHAESGDVDAKRRGDSGFLQNNMLRGARRGGVLLIHDYVRLDALRSTLQSFTANDIEVVTLDVAIQQKYACGPGQLLANRTVALR